MLKSPLNPFKLLVVKMSVRSKLTTSSQADELQFYEKTTSQTVTAATSFYLRY